MGFSRTGAPLTDAFCDGLALKRIQQQHKSINKSTLLLQYVLLFLFINYYRDIRDKLTHPFPGRFCKNYRRLLHKRARWILTSILSEHVKVSELLSRAKCKPASQRRLHSCECVFVLPFSLWAGILYRGWVRTDFGPEVQHLCHPGVASSCVPDRTSRADCGRTPTCRCSPASLRQHTWRQQ